MIKFGVTTIKQLSEMDLQAPRLVGAHLLLKLDGLDPGRSRMIRQRILMNILMPNSTGKTTWGNRFADIDEQLAPLLIKSFPTRLDCLDLGVSDGSTALDLFQRLASHQKLSYLMADINRYLFIRENRFVTDVCDDNGNLIQLVAGPCVIPISSLYHIHPLQLINRAFFLYGHLFRSKQVSMAWREQSLIKAHPPFIRYDLLASEVQKTLKSDPRLAFRLFDLFYPLDLSFDFVRMMNVLNRKKNHYGFDDSELGRGSQSVKRMVRESGLLLVGRTIPDSNGSVVTNATLFQKTPDSFRMIRRLGEGSEIEMIFI